MDGNPELLDWQLASTEVWLNIHNNTRRKFKSEEPEEFTWLSFGEDNVGQKKRSRVRVYK